MRKLLLSLVALALFLAPTLVRAAALTINDVNTSYEIVAAGATGNSQAGSQIISPSLSGTAGNPVTLKSSLDGKVSNFSISAGSSLTFTPAEVSSGTKKTINIAISGTLTVGQSSVLTMSGSGITTKTVTISVVAAGGSTGTGATGTTGTTGAATGVGGTPASSGPSGFSKALVQNLADPAGFVYISWGVVRGAINILLILALMVISFSNILRINLDTYTIKKALPNLVIGVILANASFLIVKYMADIATAAVYFFVNLPAGAAAPTGYKTFVDFFAAVLKLLGTTSVNSSFIGFGPLLAIIFIVVAIIFILWLAFILYFRLVAIYLLTILAPLAFVAYGIPGFEKYFKMWWQQFVKWLFMLVAICAVFWLMLVIGGASTGNNSIASLLIMYLMFFTALTLPSKMGGAIVDKVSKGFQKYTGLDAARKAGTDYANTKISNAGKWAASRTPGLYRLQERNRIKKENFEKDLANRRKAASTRASSGSTGRRAASLLHEESIIGNNDAAQLAKNATSALTPEIAESLNNSEFAKITAEKLKDIELNTRKIEFYTKAGAKTKDASGNDVYLNPKIKEVIDGFAKASSQAAALTEAVGTEEKKATGGYTNKRLDALSAAEQYSKMDKEISDQTTTVQEAGVAEAAAIAAHGVGSAQHIAATNARRTAIIGLRNTRQRNRPLMAVAQTKFDAVKGSHTDLAGLSISTVSSRMNDNNNAQGAIWKAEKIKQVKSYNGGIDAMTEDMRKNGSAHLLTADKDNAGFVDGSHANISELASGNSMSVDMGEQDKFQKYTYTLKDWMRSNRNPNYRDAIKASLTTFVEHGGQNIDGGTLGRVDSTNVGALLDPAIFDNLTQNELSSLVSGINRLDAFGGDPGRHINKN